MALSRTLHHFTLRLGFKFNVINLFINGCNNFFQIVLSIAFACASAQFRPAPVFNADKDAVIVRQVYDLNPVDNSYVSR
jgi:hypothetical protein